MTYMVNAWLERDDPQLTVTDKHSGRVLIDLDANRVRDLLDSGEFSVKDFLAPGAELQQTVRDLFLRSAKESLTQATTLKL